MFEFNFEPKEEPASSGGTQTNNNDLVITIDKQFLPQIWRADSLLEGQVPVRISFSFTPVKGEDGVEVHLPRRDVFDIQYWLKKSNQQTPTETILMKNSEDVRANTYEGGLKVWECTYDVLGLLSKYTDEQLFGSPHTKILELGCGSGVISSYIFYRYLVYKSRQQQASKLTITVADYNHDVLRLATVYSFLLTWLAVRGENAQEMETGELNIEPSLVDEFFNFVKENVEIEYVSGAWGREFVDIVGQHKYDFVIASETIYSLETLPVFTQTLLETLSPQGQGLVAAKNVYFGVGGGIPEFVAELQKANTKYEVLPVHQANVGRSIVRISK